MSMDAPRRLVGVGVGPGNPDFLTMQAIRVLRQADAILVPETETSAGGPGRAELVVLGGCPDVSERIQRVPFAMRERNGLGPQRIESWRASADAAVAAFQAGAHTVAFATLGDPAVYSTFSYLRAYVAERLNDVTYELVPGITAMQALAAASGRPLVEGQEILALVPATVGVERVGQLLDTCDSVTIYKAGRTLAQLRAQIDERHMDAVIGVNLSLPEQELNDLQAISPEESRPYFSAVLVTPPRRITGGRL